MTLVVVTAASAIGWRRSSLVVVTVFLLANLSGARAEAGLDPPESGTIESWVTLLDDPRPAGRFGVVATVRWEGTHLEAAAFGSAAGRFDDLLAGERVLLEGRVRPTESAWLRWRHVAGRLTVEQVRDRAEASPVFAFANWVRQRLSEGAGTLSRRHRSLFTGMVLGDDRGQSAVMSDDFRAAGLGHLLVVSGQNVAFVLALAAPATSRLRPGGRVVAVVLVLLIFAVITRFEPSVMRAVTMAGLAIGSAVLGRPAESRRILAATIAVLVVVDPFLVHSAAFQLSVAATAGIVWLTPRLAELIPGPRPIALAVATTAGAQVAVTPLLVVLFGTVPLASLPANLLAGPAAGPVMMWGCTAGLAAGIFGGVVAEVIHWPTEALLWWVASVARAAALAPPATLGRESGMIVVIAVLSVVFGGRRRASRPAIAAIGLVLVVAAVETPAPPAGWSRVDGAVVWRSDLATVVRLDSPGSPQDLLEELRSSGIGRPDLIVAVDGGAADALAVVALSERFPDLPVIAPPMHRVPGARTAIVGQVIRVGDSTVEVLAVDPTLEVRIRSPPSGSGVDRVR